MQDGKALQMGTSHNLGQNFAKAFDIKFEGRDQIVQNVWTTSWGVSTRLVGALIMAHSDDEGLVLPPRVAPVVAVVIPIGRNEEEKARVVEYFRPALARMVGGDELAASSDRLGNEQLSSVFYDKVTGQQIVVDTRDQMRPGEKHYFWEQRGVPLRFEVGPRDIESGTVVLKSRLGEKEVLNVADIDRQAVDARLAAMQKALFERARAFRDANVVRLDTWAQIKDFFANNRGFVRCRFNPDREIEARIKEESKATVRCIPFDQPGGTGPDMFTGAPAEREVIFGIGY